MKQQTDDTVAPIIICVSSRYHTLFLVAEDQLKWRFKHIIFNSLKTLEKCIYEQLNQEMMKKLRNLKYEIFQYWNYWNINSETWNIYLCVVEIYTSSQSNYR